MMMLNDLLFHDRGGAARGSREVHRGRSSTQREADFGRASSARDGLPIGAEGAKKLASKGAYVCPKRGEEESVEVGPMGRPGQGRRRGAGSGDGAAGKC